LCKREQHRTGSERNDRACVTHDIAAGVHDERFRCQQRFDLFEQEQSLLATRNHGLSIELGRSGRIFPGAAVDSPLQG
jgi:hypothetical protein